MSFTFENQGTNTYLVYEIGAADELDTMSLGMLTNNTIPGFAAASFTQMDQTKYVKYNVSSKLSAAQLFAGTVNKKRLLGVFTGVVNAMLAAEDYMIDTNCILLDLNYIFADVSTCETVVVCMPIMNSDHQNPELNMFFKNIIFNTQFDQTENCDHVAQILNYLNGAQVLNLADFKNLLDSLSKNGGPAKVTPAPQVVPQPAVQQPPVQNPYIPPVQPVQPVQPVKPVVAPPVQPVKPATPVVPQVKAVPVQPVTPPVPPVQPATPAAKGKGEKPMSMFYLLQHYNKENAAIYKAQHAKGAAPASQPAAPQNFAVPGQQPAAPQNFAVPGKQPAAPQNFAVPGKQPAAPQNFAVPGQQPAAPQNFAVPGKQPAAPQNFAVPGQQPVAPQPPKPVQPQVQPIRPVQPVQPAQPVYQPPVQGGQHIDYGGTVVLGGGSSSATTILGPSAPSAQTPHLIRTKTGEKIMLNKPLFHIGKERSYADYVIADNSAVSRSHADILQENGEFYVVDTNSTNHTYVDGKQITSNVKTKLSHGTKIRFANEDFEFNLF